ncbi:ataxin-7-like protein 3B [Mastomys coucha]|uniref:ataxin-7-like protein 3B n=1 Tax=Mastomys coucha TaxID=35658 RepID=UPI0012613C83|nr:ataxin-7-like protein 3B [Mastomys coucha]
MSVGALEQRLLSVPDAIVAFLEDAAQRGLAGSAQLSESKRAPSALWHSHLPSKMEEISLANLDISELEAIAQEIYVDLIDDSCLGFCFEVHRAVKCGYYYPEFADTGSVKDFGTQPVQDKGACGLGLCSLPGEPGNEPQMEMQRSPPEFQ